MKQTYLSVGALALAAIALIVVLSSGNVTSHQSLADKVVDSGTIRVGYIVYPPDLIKDPNTGELSGINYDLVNQAAKNLGLKTEWVEEVGWDTALEGLHTGRYDMVGTFMWANATRARAAGLSRPVAYSAVYPYVRGDDYRFDNDLNILNSANFTIATVDGEMTSIIAKNQFPNAKTYSLPDNASLSEALLGVESGKADITFIEPAIAKDYLKNNPGSLRPAGTVPIRVLANVFAVERGQEEFLSMWNGALTELVDDGTVERMLEKYGAKDSFVPVASPIGSNWQ